MSLQALKRGSKEKKAYPGTLLSHKEQRQTSLVVAVVGAHLINILSATNYMYSCFPHAGCVATHQARPTFMHHASGVPVLSPYIHFQACSQLCQCPRHHPGTMATKPLSPCAMQVHEEARVPPPRPVVLGAAAEAILAAKMATARPSGVVRSPDAITRELLKSAAYQKAWRPSG